jgi:mannitol-specific phosphotransferase system IIBC component
LPEKESTARRNNSKHGRKIHAQKKKKEQSRKSRKRAVKRNRKYVEAHKLINPCPCGETEPCCLSYHHENGDKTGNISDMVNRGYGINRIQKEMDKCVVLCLNCHAKLHNKQKEDAKDLKVVESSV